MSLSQWQLLAVELVPDGPGDSPSQPSAFGAGALGLMGACHTLTLLSRARVLQATLTLCFFPYRVHTHWDVNISFRETSCR